MKTIDKRRYEMFVRVRDFGTTYGHLFPGSSLAGETFAAVGAAAKQLSEHAVSKMATANRGASARATAREELREMLETFSRTAREIAQDAPELTGVFQLAVRGRPGATDGGASVRTRRRAAAGAVHGARVAADVSRGAEEAR